MIKKRDNREVMTVIAKHEHAVIMQRKHSVETFDVRPAINKFLDVGESYLVEFMGGTVIRTQALG